MLRTIPNLLAANHLLSFLPLTLKQGHRMLIKCLGALLGSGPPKLFGTIKGIWSEAMGQQILSQLLVVWVEAKGASLPS